VAMPARLRRPSTAEALSERPLLVFDFHGRPVRASSQPPPLQQPPQSIREAVLAWLDQQL
jgi:hypothetical protein